jgi:hypothetical protein
MNKSYQTYKSEFNTDIRYFFDSIGPKGKISKVVELTHQGKNHYSLALGNLNDDGTIDDIKASNNSDMRLIIETVGYCVEDFFESYPNAIVSIEGNTTAKMYLYHKLITRYLELISPKYEVLGFFNQKLEPFQKDKIYSDIVVSLK